MSRVPTADEEAILDALEPAAKAAWVAGLIGLPEAISASHAITNRRTADAQEAMVTHAQAQADAATNTAQSDTDARIVELAQLQASDPTTYGSLPTTLRDRYTVSTQ